MTTPTRPYREAKKRWIVKAIRKHQREIAKHINLGFPMLNDVHYDFIGRLQAELDARDTASLPIVVKWFCEPEIAPVGGSGASDAWPPPMRIPGPRDLAESKW